MEAGHFNFEAPNSWSTHDGGLFTFWVEPRMVLQDEAFSYIYAVHRCSSVQNKGKVGEFIRAEKARGTHQTGLIPFLAAHLMTVRTGAECRRFRSP